MTFAEICLQDRLYSLGLYHLYTIRARGVGHTCSTRHVGRQGFSAPHIVSVQISIERRAMYAISLRRGFGKTIDRNHKGHICVWNGQ